VYSCSGEQDGLPVFVEVALSYEGEEDEDQKDYREFPGPNG